MSASTTDTRPAKSRRPRRMVRWAALVAAAVLAAVAIFVATRPSSQATAVQSPLLGQRAPGFSETSFSGHDLKLSDYRGRYVLINFFASWCPPCQEEEPNLVKFAFQQGNDPNGAAVVSVVFDDPNAAGTPIRRELGCHLADDPGSRRAHRLRLRGHCASDHLPHLPGRRGRRRGDRAGDGGPARPIALGDAPPCRLTSP